MCAIWKPEKYLPLPTLFWTNWFLAKVYWWYTPVMARNRPQPIGLSKLSQQLPNPPQIHFWITAKWLTISRLEPSYWGRCIDTTLFRKPTERNTLLQYSSYHPLGLWDGLPYRQFLRIQRNCKWKKDFLREAAILTEKLANRGYPRHLITSARKHAWYRHRMYF